MIEAVLQEIAHYVALAVELIAILVIAIGSVLAVLEMGRLRLNPHPTGIEKRAIWLDYARWLVAGMTFQLGADVVATSFSPTWDEVWHLAVVTAIRTFLSYFLDHEVENTRKLQHSWPEPPRT